MYRRDVMKAALLSFALPAARAWAAPAPVVLELFTSQGCSSCPPADALLGAMVRQPGVIGLAWHVDYWNSLGWHDPYARAEWTERQRTYARFLESEVYTPALVVNGAAMMVGSDQSAIHRAIGHAIPPAAGVTLRRTASGLVADIDPLPVAATGILVSYDPRQSTQVGAGENGGRQLVEYRVVRDAIRLDALTPRLVLSAVPENRGAVLLIQDASWHVIGVADLPPAQGA
jgi:hypothetical protein